MNRLTTLAVLLIGLSGCNKGKILVSDVKILIENQVKSNEEILSQMKTFINRHGKQGFGQSYEIVRSFEKIHEDVIKFNVSLDKVDKNSLRHAATAFVQQTFDGLNLEHPVRITFDENTPRSLIKLQVVNLENLCLKERGGQVRFSFNNFELVVIPDKVNFRKNEKITGKIFLGGYSDEMRRPMKMNGNEIDVKGGMGLFSVDRKDLDKEQKSLKAEMIFRKKIFTTHLRLE